jgi:short-subunit dehydrogenase
MAIKLKPLDQQVMVITGASSGIGLATARKAAEHGVKLVLAARNGDTLRDVVREIEAKGGEAISVPADVSERRDVERIAQQAIDRFGRIDTWVNDAGVSIYGRLEEVSDEDSRRLFDVNFWGVVNGSLAALPHLRAQGGALINLGSEVSDAVVGLQGMYSASKHAVKGFTDALRVEVEELDEAPVAITLIQPTATDTPYPQHARNYLEEEPALPTPLDDPDDVADAILRAAHKHERDIKVGLAKANVAVSKVMPGLGDKAAKKQSQRQTYDESPRDPEGTLYSPGGEGNVRGEHGPRH